LTKGRDPAYTGERAGKKGGQNRLPFDKISTWPAPKTSDRLAHLPLGGGWYMAICVGVRREDKSEWERRVPLTPQDAAELQQKHGIQVLVQPSETRAFKESEFTNVGVRVQEDLSDCSLILGIKEIPKSFFQPDKAYFFFAHVIKGQPYNMPMLQKMLDLGCTVIDYERVVDDKNRRLIFL